MGLVFFLPNTIEISGIVSAVSTYDIFLPPQPRDTNYYQQILIRTKPVYDNKTTEYFKYAILDEFITEGLLNDLVSELKGIGETASTDARPLEPQAVSMFVLHHMRSDSFLSFVRELTGFSGLMPDPCFGDTSRRCASGIIHMHRGEHWRMRSDIYVDKFSKMQRRVSAILYLNDDWDPATDREGFLELSYIDNYSARSLITPLLNRLVIFEAPKELRYGHPTIAPNQTIKAVIMNYVTPANEQVGGSDFHIKETSTGVQEHACQLHTGIDPQATCSSAASNTSVPRLHWVSKIPIDNRMGGGKPLKPGDPGSVAHIFRDLKATGWPCPIIVTSTFLSFAHSPSRWTELKFMNHCASRTEAVMVDLKQSNDGLMTHFRSNSKIAEGSNEFSHERALLTVKDLFCIVQRRDQESGCNRSNFYPPHSSRYNATQHKDYHARYAGPFSSFPCDDPIFLQDASAYMDASPEPEELEFMVTSKGVVSTARFELEDIFVVGLIGTQRFLLSPPGRASMDAYEPYPSGHPSIKQAQRHFHSSHRLDDKTAWDVSVFEVILKEGEALWIPAGWFYHIETVQQEERSITDGGSAVTFILKGGRKARALQDGYDYWLLTNPIMQTIESSRHIVANNDSMQAIALSIYIPTLLKVLWDADQPKLTQGAESFSAQGDAHIVWRRHRNEQRLSVRKSVPWMGPLELLSRKSYSTAVRNMMKLPPHDYRMQETFPCLELLSDDINTRKFDSIRTSAYQDAMRTAKYFIWNYKWSLRPYFLHFFLTAVLGDFEGGLYTGLRFADQCMLWEV